MRKSLTSKKDEKEQEADLFASYFMAPYGALKSIPKNQGGAEKPD